MAEVLAGLLTSTVVDIAKDKLASAIKEQANLLRNFGDDLEGMNLVLESISAALQDAERRSAKEKLVQLWLKRLKNAALDISDMLEDYQDTSDGLAAKVRTRVCVLCPLKLLLAVYKPIYTCLLNLKYLAE
jgi:ABC-type transporter Mla subunit MlaD